mmetsp:Transcript_475/g.1099  ORF Transcript_475/g.1099 Transcript_475/m.1099 type:complete len:221 (-) Transcript_475:94-756(-)
MVVKPQMSEKRIVTLSCDSEIIPCSPFLRRARMWGGSIRDNSSCDRLTSTSVFHALRSRSCVRTLARTSSTRKGFRTKSEHPASNPRTTASSAGFDEIRMIGSVSVYLARRRRQSPMPCSVSRMIRSGMKRRLSMSAMAVSQSSHAVDSNPSSSSTWRILRCDSSSVSTVRTSQTPSNRSECRWILSPETSLTEGKEVVFAKTEDRRVPPPWVSDPGREV